MVVIFWVAVCLVAYTYLGYPAWLWLRSRFSRQRNSYSTATSRVSIVVPIHNEERFVTRKVENLLRLDYPREQLEIIFVCDGCSDMSVAQLRDFETAGVLRLFVLPRCGKAEALNHGFQHATGEILLFTDARQEICSHAVAALVRHFADDGVGCVSGALRLGRRGTESKLSGELLKWNFENWLRELEGRQGAVIGALGVGTPFRWDLCCRHNF